MDDLHAEMGKGTLVGIEKDPFSPIPAFHGAGDLLEQRRQSVRRFRPGPLRGDDPIGGEIGEPLHLLRVALRPEAPPGPGKAVERTDDEVYGQKRHEGHEPEGVKNIKGLDLLQEGCPTGTETGDERTGGFLLGDQRSQDRRRCNDDQEDDG